jgi:hypothetical protein
MKNRYDIAIEALDALDRARAAYADAAAAYTHAAARAAYADYAARADEEAHKILRKIEGGS